MVLWRKQSLPLFLFLALALVIAGCSGGGNGAEGGGPGGATGPGQTGEGDTVVLDADVPCEGNPVIISTLEELQAMAHAVNASSVHDYVDGYYALGNDIDASDTVNWNGGAGFEPIGTESGPFSGCFNGRGYTIKGLHINLPETQHVGLFGSAVNADLRNVVLEGANVEGDSNTGALLGYGNSIEITNAHSSGQVTGTFQTAGLVGELHGGSLTHSSSSAKVNSHWIGGTETLVLRARAVGGLVGENHLATVDSSYATGHVTGQNSVGGLVGWNHAGGVVTNSFSTGKVTGYWQVGGLVGTNENEIENSYATGDVEAETEHAGGLVGNNHLGTIDATYSTGTVTGADGIGGLIGRNNLSSLADPMLSSFWDVETSGLAESSHGEGKTTAELQQKETFADWDFDDVWSIKEGQDYPDLQSNPR